MESEPLEIRETKVNYSDFDKTAEERTININGRVIDYYSVIYVNWLTQSRRAYWYML